MMLLNCYLLGKMLRSMQKTTMERRRSYGYAKKSYTGVVKLLLAREDVEVNVKDNDGKTALMVCGPKESI
jgi:ankyrin repeat protein